MDVPFYRHDFLSSSKNRQKISCTHDGQNHELALLLEEVHLPVFNPIFKISASAYCKTSTPNIFCKRKKSDCTCFHVFKISTWFTPVRLCRIKNHSNIFKFSSFPFSTPGLFRVKIYKLKGLQSSTASICPAWALQQSPARFAFLRW